MKFAARFPIKENIVLLRLLIFSHLILWLLTIFLLSSLSQILLLISIIGFSLQYSFQQYKQVTEYHDDLCWSGENWLVTSEIHNEEIYLELKPTSWITEEFCFLKFKIQNEEKAWLFTKNGLGSRLYSELCYLVRLNIKHQNKN